MMIGQVLVLCWIPLIEAFLDIYPSCENGLHGSECQFKCYYPTYGKRCDQKCACGEKYCHYEKGCNLPAGCPAGFTGEYCNVPCQFPKYGLGCQQYCLCSKPRCNNVIGCQTRNNVMVDKRSSVKTTQTPANTTIRLSSSLSPVSAAVELISQNPGPVLTSAHILERNSTFLGSSWSTDTIFDVMKQRDSSSSPNPILDHRWIRIGFIVVGVALFFTIMIHIALSYVRKALFDRIHA